MICQIISFFFYQLDQWVLAILTQKMWQAFFKPIDQPEQVLACEALMNEGAQEAHIHTAPAPYLDGYTGADFLLQPGRVLFADESAAPI